MTASIRSVKAQYFLAYAPLGSLGPLLPIFLKHGKGFTEWQFGTLIALTAFSMAITPVVLALLADTRIDSRRLLAGSYIVGGLTLIGIYYAEGVLAVSLLYGLYSLAFMPTLPLTDALYFTVERSASAEGKPVSPYQFVRIWGTIGFIVPSVVLYFVLKGKDGTGAIMWVGPAFSFLAAANTFLLPRIRIRSGKGGEGKPSLPTTDALRTLFAPGTRVFCLVMFLAFMSAITYYNLFPHYLRDIAGVPDESVGLVMNIGVVMEIFFMLGFGPLRQRFRLKGVLILGIGAMVLRMTILWCFPGIVSALAVQVLHGLEALALYVVPMIYIDRLAGDRFRSSIQGAYMMTVLACSRMLGALAAGYIGGFSVIIAFQFASALSLAGLLILIFVFRPIEVRD